MKERGVQADRVFIVLVLEIFPMRQENESEQGNENDF